MNVTITQTALEDWLIARVAALAGEPADAIETDRPLHAYGLTSIMAVTIAAGLEDMLGVAVDATVTWDYPTIESLAAYLCGQTAMAA
jgi:phthiocerol/phenolphthiocerol synthesis type-I polyketide synthase D